MRGRGEPLRRRPGGAGVSAGGRSSNRGAEPMRTVAVGAEETGGSFGGRLSVSGEEVGLVDARCEHVEAIWSGRRRASGGRWVGRPGRRPRGRGPPRRPGRGPGRRRSGAGPRGPRTSPSCWRRAGTRAPRRRRRTPHPGSRGRTPRGMRRLPCRSPRSWAACARFQGAASISHRRRAFETHTGEARARRGSSSGRPLANALGNGVLGFRTGSSAAARRTLPVPRRALRRPRARRRRALRPAGRQGAPQARAAVSASSRDGGRRPAILAPIAAERAGCSKGSGAMRIDGRCGACAEEGRRARDPRPSRRSASRAAWRSVSRAPKARPERRARRPTALRPDASPPAAPSPPAAASAA